jgi:DNA-binding SARP family transcriptional activator
MDMLDGPTCQVAHSGRDARVHLFGGPYVTIDGTQHEVPEGSKRLLAFVALRGRRVERRYAAGTLWPVGDDSRAAGNLRSALWRLRGAGIDILECDKWSLRLADGVWVDVASVNEWADHLIAGHPTPSDLTIAPARLEALELLPGWFDDWTIMERERLRQRVLHALEGLSRICTSHGRHAEAVDAALSAVSSEPLRESAQMALIQAYLGEHNMVEAQKALLTFRQLLLRELGVPPSRELLALIYDASARGQEPDRTRVVTSMA